MNSNEISLKSKYGFDEYEVIDFILKHKNPNTHLFIKLHPSENKFKYQNLIDQSDIYILDNIELIKSIQDTLIIGMNSMLLLELALQGLLIYSYRPNQKEDFIGSELNLTYNLDSSELKLILKTNLFKRFIKRNHSFKGSLECIKKLL